MEQLLQKAKTIRIDILDMIYAAKAPHIASCFSVADILNILYGKILHVDPKFLANSKRDYLIMSKGHAAAALYATLAHYGFFSTTELATFYKNASRLAGHVTTSVPGIEFTTGALGHGLSVACGIALASKNRVYVIISDGECDEGSIWEAALFAPYHHLNNLTLIIDYNKIQSFGRVERILSLEPLVNKWKAFNWEVLEADGHNYEELKIALSSKAKLPKVIIAHTIKGKGVSFMQDDLIWHYRSPNEQQYQQAREELLG
jgi:transketolase